MDYLDTRGRIFDIQRFSVHDGPGIRTIVFLKGCLFRCKWCCNPESQEFEIQQMNMAGKPKTVGRDVSVRDIIDEIVNDTPYYKRSGGGLTLSGGESLLQPEFAKALFITAHSFGINTAIESTGAVDYKIIEDVRPHIDYFLMDIKHMNSEKHREFISKGNEKVLENAVKIAQNAKNLIIRVPVIPAFNDTDDEIKDIARFAASLPNVKKMHILPYHRLGIDKYTGLGREYLLPDILPPDDGKMASLKRAAEICGIECQIGG
ncbi:MAG: glycyl-radical enzyme activating protein [Clostridia bacterium]|nr:glycyl-radical enzyme activating protein [Clostridia bacterium]